MASEIHTFFKISKLPFINLTSHPYKPLVYQGPGDGRGFLCGGGAGVGDPDFEATHISSSLDA